MKQAPFSNGLTPAQLERLAILAEECGEVCQIVGKIIRHGFESFDPNDKAKVTNRELLEKEIGDTFMIAGIMVASTDVSHDNILDHSMSKAAKMAKYLHHQKPEPKPFNLEDN